MNCVSCAGDGPEGSFVAGGHTHREAEPDWRKEVPGECFMSPQFLLSLLPPCHEVDNLLLKPSQVDWVTCQSWALKQTLL